MDLVVAAAIVLAFIALGEGFSLWSRARIPALLVAMLGLFIVVKLGIVPETVIQASSLAVVGAVLQPAIMVHLGSLIPIATIRQQYKAVLIAVGGMVVAAALILGIGTLLFDYGTAVAGTGPLVGGIVSTLLTTQGLTAGGFAALAVIPPLILMLQSLPSMPLASTLLRRYALSTMPEHPSTGSESDHQADGADTGPAAARTRRPLVPMPGVFRDNQFVLIFLIMAIGAGAVGLESLTGLSYSIWGLALGIAATWLGVLPDRALERANGLTVAMVGIIAIVLEPLLTASLAEVFASLAAVVTIIVLGMAGILLGGAIVTKLVGWNMSLGMSVALTAMFGFPADYLIAHEVSRSTARNAHERQQLLDRILPPMLIGGFTSVSAGSIVIASILVQTL